MLTRVEGAGNPCAQPRGSRRHRCLASSLTGAPWVLGCSPRVGPHPTSFPGCLWVASVTWVRRPRGRRGHTCCWPGSVMVRMTAHRLHVQGVGLCPRTRRKELRAPVSPGTSQKGLTHEGQMGAHPMCQRVGRHTGRQCQGRTFRASGKVGLSRGSSTEPRRAAAGSVSLHPGQPGAPRSS